MSTVEFKLITLLPWDLQNQFGVGYLAISYYKYCKIIKWESKTRVTSSNPRVTSSNSWVRRLKAGVARLKARVARLNARVGRLKVRVRRSKHELKQFVTNSPRSFQNTINDK